MGTHWHFGMVHFQDTENYRLTYIHGITICLLKALVKDKSLKSPVLETIHVTIQFDGFSIHINLADLPDKTEQNR